MSQHPFIFAVVRHRTFDFEKKTEQQQFENLVQGTFERNLNSPRTFFEAIV